MTCPNCLTRVILDLAFVLGVCAFVTRQTGAADGQAKSGDGLPLRVKEVLHWLPADTQTVVVGLGPFGFPESREWNGGEAFVRKCLFRLF
jgi:hypothetical protein